MQNTENLQHLATELTILITIACTVVPTILVTRAYYVKKINALHDLTLKLKSTRDTIKENISIIKSLKEV